MLWYTVDEQYPFNSLDSMRLFGTYEEWLEGRPDLSDIPDLLQRWGSRASGMYPDWPVHSAVHTEDYRIDGFLPAYVCIGLFIANWTREPNWCGSAMVIIWYQEKNPINDGITLPTITRADWQALSKDFDY